VQFNGRGLAELIRLVLIEAGVEYEDRRFDNFPPELKASGKLTFGQVPLWEDENGALVQSVTIARYLAKKHNLNGKTDFEAAQIDSILDGLADLRSKRINAKTEEEQAKFVAEVAPLWLGYFEAILKKNGSGYLVGNSLTLADLALYIATDGLKNTHQDVVAKFDSLVKHHQTIGSRPKIADWVAKRPVTSF
jgi:glutathione S-transferase